MPAPQNPSDSKIEQEEGDQSQPMDLAQRISLTSAVPLSLPAPTGPVTMRTHIDPSKPGFMTLHMRVPTRPSAQTANQIIGSSSMLPASITAAQHLGRPAIRLSSGESPQCHTGSPAPSAFSSTPTCYAPPPSSAALVSTRHVPIATMHPVGTLGTSSIPSNATMASIIRGNHSTTQSAAGHLINAPHLPYSSHVPRGPAAVANISAAPKSAVATPILRPAHTSAPVTLPVPVSPAISSSHIQITPRPTTVTGGRTITPPMPKSASPSLTMPQVIDLQKSAHGPVSHLAQTRTMEPTVWAGIPHGPATNKQVHISQPVVQHIQQQVSEQGFYKSSSPIANIVTTTNAHQVSNTAVSIVSSLPSVSPSSSLSIIHHSSMAPTSAAVARPCAASPVVTICATPISSASTQSVGMASSRTTLVQPPSLQVITHTTASPLTSHPTVTVVSGKSIPQMVHTVTPIQQQSAQAVTIAAPPTRTTKVYPQQLPTTTHSVLEPSENRNIYVAQPQQNLTCCANTVTTVVLSENCNEGGASMRLASLPRAGVPGGNYTVPYYSVGRTITMHSYPGSAPSQGFAAAIASTQTVRPGIIAQQASGSLVTTAQTSSHTVVTTNVAPVRPLNSVMVTVDPSRHHVALHSAYGSSAGAGLPTSDAASSQVTSTGSAMYTVSNSVNPAVGLLTSGYGSQQGQNTLPNHSTSPRPSILRKRTSEGVTSVAKKNLLASLPPSGPASPHLETPNSGNVNTISSPKPQSNDQQRENGSTSSNTGSDVSDSRNNIPSISILPAVQESLDTTDQSSGTSVEMSNKLIAVPSVPVEASPRKKPRKQQLAANELIEAHSSDGEDDFEKDVKDTIRKETIKEEEESVKWVSYCKRPKISLMTGYHHSWKSRHNHFAKYTDVKPKEKRQTVNDLANQKGVLQKANGWKIFHLTSQMDEVVELEDSVYGRLSELLNFVENNPPAWRTKPLSIDEERVLNKISDLIKGNLQRSKIVQDQVGEAKQQVLKMLEHKPHIIDIISKYISKRTLRKKEKN